MKKTLRMASIATIIFTSSCASNVTLEKYTTGVAKGPVVSFKKSEYHMDIKRELVACGFINGDIVIVEEKSVIYKPIIDFRVKTTFTLKQHILKDLDNLYAINFEDSDNMEIDSEYNFYDDGSLKSINSTMTDKTAEIIAGVVGTASTLAIANATGGLSLLPEYLVAKANKNNSLLDAKKSTLQKGKKITLCNNKTRLLLANRKVANDRFNSTKGPISKAIKNIKSIQEKLKALKDVSQEQQLKLQLKLANNDLASAVESFNNAEATIANISKKLTSHEHHYITRVVATKSEWVNKALTMSYKPGSMLEKWLNEDAIKKDKTIPKKIENSLFHYASFENMGKEYTLGNSLDGIAYQIPSQGVLRICKVSPCNSETSSHKVVAHQSFNVPDSGYFGLLSLKSAAFEDKTIEADFGEKGGLKRYKYISNSKAEAASNSLKGLADQVKGYNENKNNLPIDDLTKQNELLQLQIDNLSLENELDLLFQ